jgi:hypothetical protein
MMGNRVERRGLLLGVAKKTTPAAKPSDDELVMLASLVSYEKVSDHTKLAGC